MILLKENSWDVYEGHALINEKIYRDMFSLPFAKIKYNADYIRAFNKFNLIAEGIPDSISFLSMHFMDIIMILCLDTNIDIDMDIANLSRLKLSQYLSCQNNIPNARLDALSKLLIESRYFSINAEGYRLIVAQILQAHGVKYNDGFKEYIEKGFDVEYCWLYAEVYSALEKKFIEDINNIIPASFPIIFPDNTPMRNASFLQNSKRILKEVYNIEIRLITTSDEVCGDLGPILRVCQNTNVEYVTNCIMQEIVVSVEEMGKYLLIIEREYDKWEIEINRVRNSTFGEKKIDDIIIVTPLIKNKKENDNLDDDSNLNYEYSNIQYRFTFPEKCKQLFFLILGRLQNNCIQLYVNILCMNKIITMPDDIYYISYYYGLDPIVIFLKTRDDINYLYLKKIKEMEIKRIAIINQTKHFKYVVIVPKNMPCIVMRITDILLKIIEQKDIELSNWIYSNCERKANEDIFSIGLGWMNNIIYADSKGMFEHEIGKKTVSASSVEDIKDDKIILKIDE